MCLICCFIGNGHVNRFSLSAKRKYVHPYLNQFRTIQLVYLLSHASSSVRLLESCHVHYPYFLRISMLTLALHSKYNQSQYEGGHKPLIVI